MATGAPRLADGDGRTYNRPMQPTTRRAISASLVLAGDIREAEALALARAHFESIPAGEAVAPVRARVSPSEARIDKDPTDPEDKPTVSRNRGGK